ncbi:hypothetical protein [Serratia proteamaculans]|uniref:hypothetical protein n=1 Tax=Serratia proteamaculans TaxID=28151 RepID=UPI0024B8D2CB|nr:hypothetical protein [Serratia proteamaculans]
MEMTAKKIFTFVLLAYLTVISFNGVVTVLAYSTTRLLLLYKDFFSAVCLVFMFFVCYAYRFKVSKQSILLILAFMCFLLYAIFYMFYTLNIGRFDVFRVLVQFRVEFFTFSALLISAALVMLDTEGKKNVLDKIIKFYIFFCVINAIMAIVQSFSAGMIYAFAGYEPGPEFTSFGKSYGLSLKTTTGFFRAIGFLTGPFNLSEYLFFGMTLQGFVSKNRRKIFILTIYAAIICSTSKTAIIMSTIYFGYLLIRPLFGVRQSTFLVTILMFFLFVIFYISITSNAIYDIFSSKDNTFAYNSIYLRMYFIQQVLQDNSFSDLFGVGYGVNGNAVVGSNNDAAVPLDSIYIYILSNYGYFGIIMSIILILFIVLFIYSKCKSSFPHDVYLYWLISLSLNYGYNNPMTNYPGYIFPIIITALFFSLGAKYKSLNNGGGI